MLKTMLVFFIIMYIASVVMLSLEFRLKARINQMVGIKQEGDDVVLNTFISFMPVINTFVIVIDLIMDRECIVLLRNHKKANRMYKCIDPNCGLFQRRYQQKRYKFKDRFWSYKNEYILEECGCKECGGTVARRTDADDMNIVKAEKISIMGSYKRVVEEHKYINQRNETHKLQKKMKEIELNDEQLAAYTRIQEKKLNEYLLKAEEIKKELQEQENKKIINHI